MISTKTLPIFHIFHHEVSKLVYVARSPRTDNKRNRNMKAATGPCWVWCKPSAGTITEEMPFKPRPQAAGSLLLQVIDLH